MCCVKWAVSKCMPATCIPSSSHPNNSISARSAHRSRELVSAASACLRYENPLVVAMLLCLVPRTLPL